MRLTSATAFALHLILFFNAAAMAQSDWGNAFKWREIGPTATGGRVVDIDVANGNPHHIFVASAAGGLWETTNNGTTWKCIFEKESTTTIGDIAVDPEDAKTIWIGTGEANNQRSSLWGDGVYKTTDGGKTWSHLGLKETHHIGRVVIDPKNRDRVYVAALGHLYTANPERGLYRTTDGGETWEKVLYVNEDVGVVDVVIDPENTNVLLAATYERRRRAWDFDGAGPGSAIYRSTDGGDTWTKLTNGLPSGNIGRIGLDIFAGDSKVIFAAVSNQNPRPDRRRGSAGSQQSNAEPKTSSVLGIKFKADEFPTKLGFTVRIEGKAFQITKVEDGEAKTAGIRKGDRLVAAGGVSADGLKELRRYLKTLRKGDRVDVKVQRDDQVIEAKITAGRPVVARPARAPRQIGGEIYKSTDGGETWKKVNRSPVGGSPAYYYGQIRIDPSDQDRLYVLSVPVYVSEDGGRTFRADGARSTHVDHHALWINPENSDHVLLGNDGGFHISYDRCKTWDHVYNLPLAQFYAIGVDMQEPFHVYGGLQDNGSWGGPSQGGGPGVARGSWSRVGGGDGFYVQVDPNDSDIVISESQFGVISRLNRKTGERKSIRPPRSTDQPHRYNWNSPILMSQHDSRVIYFGGNKLFKSYNQGDDWLTISPDLTTNDPEKLAGNVPHCTITTIAESAKDKKMLMVGTDDGKVQLTTDGGITWQDLSDNFPHRPENWWCSRVEFSRFDKATAFVSFTGYREDDFRSFVYKTKDNGATWESISNNLPDAPVNVIKQDPKNANTLYVGTEFSVFVSLDEGATWMELDEDLPRVSVQDLLVHPRDHALVIGTHGRGIFVLDDIEPLQEFAPSILEEPAHLFAIDDWKAVRGSGGGWFGGDRKRLSPDPASAVNMWVHLKEKSEGDISLKIFNSEDKEVGTVSVRNRAGLQKLSVRASNRAFRSRGRSRSNRLVLGPGEYRAVLQIGDDKQEQAFRVGD